MGNVCACSALKKKKAKPTDSPPYSRPIRPDSKHPSKPRDALRITLVMNNPSKKKKKKKKRKKQTSCQPGLQEDSDPDLLSCEVASSVDALEHHVENLKTHGETAKSSVGQYDKDLIDQQVTDLSQSVLDARDNVTGKLENLATIISDFDEFVEQVDDFIEWLEENQDKISDQAKMGSGVDECRSLIAEHTQLLADFDSWRPLLQAAHDKASSLDQTLGQADRELVHQRLHYADSLSLSCSEAGASKSAYLSRCREQRERLSDVMTKVVDELSGLERQLVPPERVPLRSADVQGLIDYYRTVQLGVKSLKTYMEQMRNLTQQVKLSCEDLAYLELEKRVTDLENRYARLQPVGSGLCNNLRQTLLERRQFEADQEKVESWVKEAETKVSAAFDVDGPLSELEEQQRVYESLLSSSQVFEQLLSDLDRRSEAFIDELSEKDHLDAKNALSRSKMSLQSLAAVLKDRVRSLVDVIETRTSCQDELDSAERFLEQIQDELKRSNRPIGFKVIDAVRRLEQFEQLGDKMASWQDRMETLGQGSREPEQLASAGRIRGRYEQLVQTILTQCPKMSQAVDNRSAYHATRESLEAELRILDEEMTNAQTAADPASLEKSKIVLSRLADLDPLLESLVERAQSIGVEGSGADRKIINEQIHGLKMAAERIAKSATSRKREVLKASSSRDALEQQMVQAAQKIRQRMAPVKANEFLGLDVDDINSKIGKCQATQQFISSVVEELAPALREVREEIKEAGDDASLSKEMQERLVDFENLVEDAVTRLEEKVAVLEGAKREHELFDHLYSKVRTWITGASACLRRHTNGIDARIVSESRKELNRLFPEFAIPSESSMNSGADYESSYAQDLREMKEVSESIASTLDQNDSATFTETTRRMEQQVLQLYAERKVLAGKMTEADQLWKKYREQADEMEKLLTSGEVRWSSVNIPSAETVEQAGQQSRDMQAWTAELNQHKEKMAQLTDTARALMKLASPDCQASMKQELDQLNRRFNSVCAQADNLRTKMTDRHKTWMALEKHCEELHEMAEEAEDHIFGERPEAFTTLALKHKRGGITESLRQCDLSEDKMRACKECCTRLSQHVSETRIQVIETVVVEVVERVNRTRSKLGQVEKSVVDELETRNKYSTRLDEIQSDMKELLGRGSSISPNQTPAQRARNSRAVAVLIREESKVRVREIKTVVEELLTKYKRRDSIPIEMKDKLDRLERLKLQIDEEVASLESEGQEADEKVMELKAKLNETDSGLRDIQLSLSRPLYVNSADEALESFNQSLIACNRARVTLDMLAPEIRDAARRMKDPDSRVALLGQLRELEARHAGTLGETQRRCEVARELAELAKEFEDKRDEVNRWLDASQLAITPNGDSNANAVVSEPGDSLNAEMGALAQVMGEAAEARNSLHDMQKAAERLGELSEVSDVGTETKRCSKAVEDAMEALQKREELLHQQMGVWREFERDVEAAKKWAASMKAEAEFHPEDRVVDMMKKQQMHVEMIEAKAKGFRALEKRPMVADILRRCGGHQDFERAKEKLERLENDARRRLKELEAAAAEEEDLGRKLEEVERRVGQMQERARSMMQPSGSATTQQMRGQLMEHQTLLQELEEAKEAVKDLTEEEDRLRRSVNPSAIPLAPARLCDDLETLESRLSSRVLPAMTSVAREEDTPTVSKLSQHRQFPAMVNGHNGVEDEIMAASVERLRTAPPRRTSAIAVQQPEAIGALAQLLDAMEDDNDAIAEMEMPAPIEDIMERVEAPSARSQPFDFSRLPVAAETSYSRGEDGLKVPDNAQLHTTSLWRRFVLPRDSVRVGGNAVSLRPQQPLHLDDPSATLEVNGRTVAVPHKEGRLAMLELREEPGEEEETRVWVQLRPGARVSQPGLSSRPVRPHELYIQAPDTKLEVNGTPCVCPPRHRLIFFVPAPADSDTKLIWTELGQAVTVNSSRMEMMAPHRLRHGDQVMTGTEPRRIEERFALLLPLPISELSHVWTTDVKHEALVTVDCLSTRLRVGEYRLLGAGQTCTVDGVTTAVDDDEVLILHCPPPSLPLPQEVIRPRKTQEERTARRPVLFSTEEVKKMSPDEINKNVDALTAQMQMAEKNLLDAISRQEELTEAVQAATKQLEETEKAVTGLGDDDDEIEAVAAQVDAVKDEVKRVVRAGNEMLPTAAREDRDAMQAALDTLQQRSRAVDEQMEAARRSREAANRDSQRLEEVKDKFLNELEQLDTWIANASQRLREVEPNDSADDLREKLKESRRFQDELNGQIQQLDDLVVHFDHLAEFEAEDRVRPMRERLLDLKKILDALKQACMEHQAQLKDALKEAEGKNAEVTEMMEDDSWLNKAKQMRTPSLSAMERGQKQKEAEEAITEKLSTELSEHQRLLRSVQRQGTGLQSSDVEPSAASRSDEEKMVANQWTDLARQARDRNEQLRQTIAIAKTQDLELLNTEILPVGPVDMDPISEQLAEAMKELNAALSGTDDECDPLDLQKRYQKALQHLSGCLDTAEMKLFTTHPKSGQPVSEDLKSVAGQLDSLKESVPDLLRSVDPDQRELIAQTVRDLDSRACTLQNEAREADASAKAEDERMDQFSSELEDMRAKLDGVRRQAEQRRPGSGLVERDRETAALEDAVQQFGAKLDELAQRGDEVIRLGKESAANVPSTVTALKLEWEDLRLKSSEKREEVQRVLAAHSQYERMLHNYGQYLETGHSKLKVECVTVKDLDDMRRQVAHHRDFFADLESHRIMLDTLAARVDVPTRQRHQTLHARLVKMTRELQEKANVRSEQMQRTIFLWSAFNERFVETRAWLESLTKEIPEITSKIEAKDELKRKIGVLSRLAGEIKEEKGKMYEMLDNGRTVMQRISCAQLEDEVAQFAEQWMSVSENISESLTSLKQYVDLAEQFESEAVSLSRWLSASGSRLAGLSVPPASRPAQFRPARSTKDDERVLKSRHQLLTEFQKEIEEKKAVKASVISVGAQLIKSNKCDQERLAAQLKKIDDSWQELMSAIPAREADIMRALLSAVPAQQASREMLEWGEVLEENINRESLTSLASLDDLKTVSTRYRGYLVDVRARYNLVECLSAVGGKDDDDRINDNLLTLWNKMSERLSERLKRMEWLISRWSEFDETTQAMETWCLQQSDRLNGFQRCTDQLVVSHCVRETKQTQEQIRIRVEALDDLHRNFVNTLSLERSVNIDQTPIRRKVDYLTNQFSNLGMEAQQVLDKLETISSLWNVYNKQRLALCNLLTDTEYLLEANMQAKADYQSFQVMVSRLHELHQAYDASGSTTLLQFSDTSTQLAKVCDAGARQAISGTRGDMEGKWNLLITKLSKRVDSFDDIIRRWASYEAVYADSLSAVERHESTLNALLFGELSQQSGAAIQRCDELTDGLEALTDQLCHLKSESNHLGRFMDEGALLAISSNETSLSQRLRFMKAALRRFAKELQTQAVTRSRFTELEDNLEAVVEEMRRSLERPVIPGGEEERLAEISNWTHQSGERQAQIEETKELGRQLNLSPLEIGRVRDLDTMWKEKRVNIAYQFRSLMEKSLEKTTFDQKCEKWKAFLDSVEKDLTVPVAERQDQLMQQRCGLENLSTILAGHDRVLVGLITEGRELVQRCSGKDRIDLTRKLHQLDEQWQTVVRQSAHRKAMIEQRAIQWFNFDSLSDHLNVWLGDVEERLAAYDFNICSVQRMLALVEGLRGMQREIQAREEMYQRCVEQGHTLGDSTVLAKLQGLHKRWCQVLSDIETYQYRLDDLLRIWYEVDDGIEDILEWLKEIREFGEQDLPSQYDDLQLDLQQCKLDTVMAQDFLATFAASKDERLRLREKENKLSRVVAADDIRFLRERLLLMEKQWDELHHQLSMKEQVIEHAMSEWKTFLAKYREFVDWLNDIEERISANQEYHVEDLLEKLQSDYKAEIEGMRVSKEELLTLGERLKKASSEVRARDIEFRNNKIRERWASLLEITDSRQRRLQETLQAVRQLEDNMNKLKRWLQETENSLFSQLTYQYCDFNEIQRKIHEQQDLQREVETRTTGVTAVLNLCEVLLHDKEACPTEVERDSITSAMSSLDTRWKRICNGTIKRRVEIEDTWSRWQGLKAEIRQLDVWLTGVDQQMKKMQAPSDLREVRATLATLEEYERQLEDHLKDLDSVNKNYRSLNRENKADINAYIRSQVDLVNNHFDETRERIMENIRKVKQLTNMQDDFDSIRLQISTWLKEVSAEMTSALQSPRSDIERSSELQRIHATLTDQNRKLTEIERAGLQLAKGKAPTDLKANIQSELNRFLHQNQEVMSQLEALKPAENGLARKHGDTTDYRADANDASSPISPLMTKNLSSVPVSPMRAGDGHGRDFDAESVLSDITEELLTTGRQNSDRLTFVERCVDQLETIISSANRDLDRSESLLSHRHAEAGQNTTQLLNQARGKIDQVRRLEEEVKRQTGLETSNDSTAKSLQERWRSLSARSSSPSNWGKLRDDMARLKTWLVEAEALLDNYAHQVDATDLSQIERSLKALQDIRSQLEERKPLSLAVQLSQRPDIGRSGPEVARMAHELAERWRRVFQRSRAWEVSLGRAVSECAGVRAMLASLSGDLRDDTEAILDAQSRSDRRVGRKLDIVEKDLRLLEDKAQRWGKYVDLLSGGAAGDSSADLLSVRHRLRQLCEQAREQIRLCERVSDLQSEVSNRDDKSVLSSLGPRYPSMHLDKSRSISNQGDNLGDEDHSNSQNAAAFSVQRKRRRASLLEILYRSFLYSLPLESLVVILCLINCLLQPYCENEQTCAVNLKRLNLDNSWPDEPPF